METEINLESPSLTFSQLLGIFEMIADGHLEIDEDQGKILRRRLIEKVDSVRWVLDSWADDAARHRKYADEHQTKVKVLENKARRLRQYILDHMRIHGLTFVKGDRFKVHISRTVKVDVQESPTPALYRRYPSLIKREYKWNKIAARNALQAGDETLEGLIRLENTESVQFKTLTTGIKETEPDEQPESRPKRARKTKSRAKKAAGTAGGSTDNESNSEGES